MAKLSIGQKAERVLKLLLGLRKARIAESLKQYGFAEKDRQEGWRLLQALTEGRLSLKGTLRQDPALLQRLDDWENRWFPVASASLKGRFPNVHEWLFLNLTQTDGPAVVISVGTFLQRLNKLASEPSLGADAAAARSLLEARGLNASIVAVASELIAQLGAVEPAQPAAPVDPEAQAAAESAMWRWYLEWGEIARVAVTDRQLLRELGFLNAKRPVADEGPAVAEAESEVASGAE
jgi:hypothetical protein